MVHAADFSKTILVCCFGYLLKVTISKTFWDCFETRNGTQWECKKEFANLWQCIVGYFLRGVETTQCLGTFP